MASESDFLREAAVTPPIVLVSEIFPSTITFEVETVFTDQTNPSPSKSLFNKLSVGPKDPNSLLLGSIMPFVTSSASSEIL